MVGTDGLDSIVGLGARDRLTGDGNGAAVIGDDELFDGPGNDTVNAAEGARDVIDCSAGRDRGEFDAGLDSVKHCEIKTPL